MLKQEDISKIKEEIQRVEKEIRLLEEKKLNRPGEFTPLERMKLPMLTQVLKELISRLKGQ